MRVDKEAVQALAELLTSTGLTEIEIAEGENKIRVARTLQQAPAVSVSAPVAQAPVASAPAQPAAADAASHPGAVKSPIVGVVYLTPEPSAPMFVTPGSRVQEGQTLLLIEAMKTFNQIKAPKSGVLREYLVESGEPVEFGAPLAIIE